MTFLRDILSKGFPPKTGVQGLSGTFNPVQGTQGGQGVQGITGYQSGTLLVNSQSGQYNLQASDVGKVVTGVTTVGISSNIFNPGDIITILNNSNTDTLKVALNSPAVKLYLDGAELTSNTQSLIVKSFASLICTKLNQFVLSHNPFIPITATGGNEILNIGNYTVHVFTSSGTFSVTSVPSSSPSTIEYVVIAGGGNGTNYGGGGGGGLRTGSFEIAVGSTPVSIGGAYSPSNFTSITSTAGGSSSVAGGSGGGGSLPSGAGGAGNSPPTSPPQGNPGGNGNGPTSTGEGGGGGGAGAAGSNSPGTSGGSGGIGLGIDWGLPPAYGTPGPSPTLRYFSGGGGGGVAPTGGPGAGNGGSGGGGSGKPSSPSAVAVAGTVNTGGGAGGGTGTTLGGSGIVLIRYKRV
jgi:hypothetical protein